MVLCTTIKADGSPCKSHAIKNSDKCFFHSEAVSNTRGVSRLEKKEMSRAILSRKKGVGYTKLFGRWIGELPRSSKIEELEKFYDDGGLIATAIDSYVSVALANGFQFIDTATNQRETENTKIVEELDERVNLHKAFEKTYRAVLVPGFAWGEMDIKNNKINKLLFLPANELEVVRKRNGDIIKVIQRRGLTEIAAWGGEKLKNIFLINGQIKNSEAFGQGLLERVYTEAKDWKEQGKDLKAVTRFVSYPFRVVKVGSDTYPASEASVTSVGDQVESLEPGDWLATRHNLEFEFHAPKIPDALVAHYVETTKQLIVSLGVPSLYTALSEIDAQMLKEIRSIFNSTVQAMQENVRHEFEQQIIKRQFELLGKLKKRTDKSPVQIAWNPLTVAILSILELTQLVAAGVVGLEESRRILESMGYGQLRGEEYKDDMSPLLESQLKTAEASAKAALQAPKESRPTSDKPDKTPSKPRTKREDTPKTKDKPTQPKIKRPQPNSPKASLTFEEWIQALELLKEVDKFAVYKILRTEVRKGFKVEEK